MDVSLFTRKRYASKIKDLREKYKKAVDKVWSQAENYPDSLEELFSLQNFADLSVIGYKVLTLDFGFKISGDAAKPGHFYFGFTHPRVNGKTSPVPKCSGFVTNPEKSPLV